MSKRPLFSVVLPTLGKSQYLEQAIQSVLAQTYGDLELIVSNNSPSDDAYEVVRRFDDRRIRYFKTGKTLPIGESYEYAMSHYRGEYVTFLGDDDAHSAVYLEKLATIVQDQRPNRLIACRTCDYYFYDVTLNGIDIDRNVLAVAPFTNELICYDSRDVLRHIFSSAGLSKESGVAPRGRPLVLNAAYHRSIIETIIDRLGYFFPPIIFGDVFTEVATLSVVSEYLYLDSPLTVHGFSDTSLTAIDTMKRMQTFVEQNREYLRTRHTPLSFYSPSNHMADTILMAKAAIGDELLGLDINLNSYFRKCLVDLQGFSLEGCDVTAELAEFWDVLTQYDSGLKRELWDESHRLTRRGYLLFSRLIRRVGAYKPLKRLTDTSKIKYLPGNEFGFSDITECARTIDDDFLSKFAVV